MSAVPITRTSAARAVTAQDLELERAELLPARETLYLGPVNPGGPTIHIQPWGPVYPDPRGPVHFYPASAPARGE
jgi:hypothetical protein